MTSGWVSVLVGAAGGALACFACVLNEKRRG